MESVPVSTKTIIATSNLQFDIIQIFHKLPLTETTQNAKVKLLYYQNQIRGDESLMKKKTKKCFRNAVNVIIQLDETKNINFKVSKNGKFQLTGCKNEDHAIRSVTYFIQQLLQHCPGTVQNSYPFVRVYFQTVMTNIDFSLGFCVDRQKLDHLLNQDTPFHSLLETSFGYTGVNIKFPMEKPWWKQEVPVANCDLEDPDQWSYGHQPLETLTPVTKEMLNKKKYNTFLVFHSGNVIMSGMTKTTMHDDYQQFLEMIRQWRGQIEENIKM